MNKTDQMLGWMLFLWLPTLSGNCSAEQRVLWMKAWYEETWMSTQALRDSLLMKYSKSHFQGGWKFSLMCTNAFDNFFIYQIIMEVLSLGIEKITLHPNIVERLMHHTSFLWLKMSRCLITILCILHVKNNLFCYVGYDD